VALAEDSSFRNVKMPDVKGRQVKAVLTFSDSHHAIEVRGAKGDFVSIPYDQIDKCSYEFTKHHHLAPSGLLTRSKSHWLEVDYRESNTPKTFVLRMEKRDYIRILDAVKAHTGKDPEILGNANKGINKN
jgi:hypothetical protein